MAAAVPVIGLALAAYGTVYQAQAASAAAKTNANYAEANAAIARDAAAAESRRQKLQTQSMLANIRTGYASSGVTLEGSPLDVLSDSAAQAELDNLLITYNGELKARGLQETASMDRSRAKYATQGGYLSAAAGALLTGGNLYNQSLKRTASVNITD